MGIKRYYKQKEFTNDVERILKIINKKHWDIRLIYGIPRGGAVLAVYLSHIFDIPVVFGLSSVFDVIKKTSVKSNKNEVIREENVLIVDDISCTGETLLKIPNIGLFKCVTLFRRETTGFNPDFFCNSCKDEWIVFPWERIDSKTEKDDTKI